MGLVYRVLVAVDATTKDDAAVRPAWSLRGDDLRLARTTSKGSSVMSIPETPLARISVADAMHTGILMTDPDTPLRLVARLMAERRVHVLAVAEDGQMRRPARRV